VKDGDESPVVRQDAKIAEPAASRPQPHQSPPDIPAIEPKPGRLTKPGKYVPSRRRPWWKWLLIGLLLLFSLAVTVLYTAALATDISRHHWADALDASRDAVPAIVGWAALLIVFFAGGTAAAERMLSVDNYALGEKQKQASRDQDSVRSASQRVEELTGKLAELTAAGEAAGSAPDTALERQIADTTARREQARQWLTSAQVALAASLQEAAEAQDKLAADFPDPTATRPEAARRGPRLTG
jgi:hypothetical protein